MGLKFAPRPVTPKPPPRPRRPREPTPVLPTPEISPFAQRVRDTIGAGIRDEQHAVQVGELVQEEWERRFGEDWSLKRREWRDRQRVADREAVRVARTPTPSGQAHLQVLRQQALEAELAVDTFTERGYHTLLSEIRPLGGEVRFRRGADRAVQALVEDVSQHVPRAWIDASNHYGTLDTRAFPAGTSTHGQYDPGPSRISVQLTGRTHVSDARQTALHELNHRMEHTTPRLVELESQFYARRTAGERYGPLPRYSAKTEGKVDQFVVPYMGRDYRTDGRGRAQFFEVLSMGSEGVLLSAYQMRQDWDMLHFILGLYAGV
jgi:hypothetical protein